MKNISALSPTTYVVGEHTHGLAEIVLSFPRGWSDEQVPGASYLAVEHFGESTETRTQLTLRRQLSRIGASVSASLSPYNTRVRIACHEERLLPAVALAIEMMMRPGFEPSEHERIMARTRSDEEFASEDPEQVASLAASRALFDSDRLGTAASGTPATRAGLTAEHARARWRRIVQTPALIVAACEDTSLARTAVDRLRDALPSYDETSRIPSHATLAPRSGQRVFVPYESPMEVIKIVVPLPVLSARDDTVLELINFAFTGGFMGLLYHRLRTEESLVYSIQTNVFRSDVYWLWELELTPDAGRTARAFRVLRDALATTDEVFADGAFETLRERFLRFDAHRLASWRSRLYAMVDAIERGRPTREPMKLPDRIRQLRPAQVREFCDAFSFAAEPRSIVHVGRDAERTGIWSTRALADVVPHD